MCGPSSWKCRCVALSGVVGDWCGRLWIEIGYEQERLSTIMGVPDVSSLLELWTGSWIHLGTTEHLSHLRPFSAHFTVEPLGHSAPVEVFFSGHTTSAGLGGCFASSPTLLYHAETKIYYGPSLSQRHVLKDIFLTPKNMTKIFGFFFLFGGFF